MATVHEDVRHDDDALIVGSDRKFGWVFVTVFALIGLVPLITRDPPDVRAWALIISAIFLGFTLLAPQRLHPLNVLWMRLAWLLNKIVSPIILGILFFGTVLPMGIILRALGKDLLRLKLDTAAKSYWIERAPPGPQPDSMRDQF